MSENLAGELHNDAIVPNSAESVASFLGKNPYGEGRSDEFTISCDHMYASNTENGEINLTEATCHSTESEVKFWKEWLILHLDLIQQQSDEILGKERTIFILQQENEMLKERISCMERGATFRPGKFFKSNASPYPDDNFEEDMTQDSGPCIEEDRDCIKLLALNCENGGALKIADFDQSHLRLSDTECQTEEVVVRTTATTTTPSSRASAAAELHDAGFNSQVNYIDSASLQAITNADFIIDNSFNSEVVVDNHNTLSPHSIAITAPTTTPTTAPSALDFAISSSSDCDPMKNAKMSIRQTRLSNSSSMSNNNDSIIQEERRLSFQKLKRKRRRIIKDSQALTTTEQYVTQSGELNSPISSKAAEVPLEVPNSINLEVPRWRVKLYGSCYSMEGTENLDDEVYNKRHMRLENDERRRKRWDVQRIREQRVIEKLKQRQERSGSGARNDETDDPSRTLWPKLEDIKFLEVTDNLPVSAFGCIIPNIPPREFSLPWLNNPTSALSPIKKASPVKRSRVRRRNPRR